MTMRWNTIVVGSGVGGLTAAVALARTGQKVLVLEQHYLPGGWMHSFSLDGYRFSPGVHYIGDLHEGGGVRKLFEGLGLGADLAFRELATEGFEHFLIGGERFDQPKGRDRWRRVLYARFPHERAGLERYFRVLDELVRELARCDQLLAFPRALLLPIEAPTLFRWGFRTLEGLMNSCVSDPVLRAVLAAQAGDHGLAPSRVSLPLHASVCAHYDEGGYYPEGGAARIPRAYLRELRRCGGEIKLGTRVTRILIEHGRACGVETMDGCVHRADDVLCNADPGVVYDRLLPRDVCRRERWRARRAEYSVSLVSAFLAVDMDLRALGYDSGNYWWYRTADVEGIYRTMERELPRSEIDGLFLTITTLKDPSSQRRGHHTVEMFTFVPYAPFARFRADDGGGRPPDYVELKGRLRDQMLDAAEHVVPGLREHVVFCELGTPLTNDYYCETVRGACYGTAKTPFQVGPFSQSASSSVPHLFFCGASTLSHGVGGAAVSGLGAAQRILGAATASELLSQTATPLRILPAEASRAPTYGVRSAA